jgi:hypothetical protein
MKSAFGKRLATLEAGNPPAPVLRIVAKNPGETADEAIARDRELTLE